MKPIAVAVSATAKVRNIVRASLFAAHPVEAISRGAVRQSRLGQRPTAQRHRP